MGNYNGIDNDWNWIGNTDTPTANDYNEIDTKSYKKVYFKKLYDIYLTKKWRKI